MNSKEELIKHIEQKRFQQMLIFELTKSGSFPILIGFEPTPGHKQLIFAIDLNTKNIKNNKRRAAGTGGRIYAIKSNESTFLLYCVRISDAFGYRKKLENYERLIREGSDRLNEYIVQNNKRRNL